MEKPLIVLIDPDEQLVHLYGAYNKCIPMRDLFILKAFIEDKEVIYVSQAEETDGNNIVSLVEEVVNSSELPPSPKRFLKYNKDGYRRVSDIKLTFSGPKDVKSLDTLGTDVFERSPMLRAMLLDGEVEILTEEEVRSIKKKRPDPKAEARRLDSILLDNHEDAENIDNIFTDENEIKEDEEVMTEAEEMIRRGFGKQDR